MIKRTSRSEILCIFIALIFTLKVVANEFNIIETQYWTNKMTNQIISGIYQYHSYNDDLYLHQYDKYVLFNCRQKNNYNCERIIEYDNQGNVTKNETRCSHTYTNNYLELSIYSLNESFELINNWTDGFLNKVDNDYVQLKFKNVPNTDLEVIITSQYIQQIQNIYIFTHSITSNSEHCYKGHTIDQKINNYQLQHGIIDENYMWISTDKLTLFANPQTCEMYYNQTNTNEYIFKNYPRTYIYKTTVYGANNQVFILDYYKRYLWQVGAYCQIGCKSCQEYTHCLNCIGHQRNHDLVQNVCQCNDGFFDNFQSYDCDLCPSLCTKCTDFNNCNDCVSSSPVQRDPQNICECPISSYEDFSNNCQACLFQCETCQNPNICLTCVPSLPERIGDTCVCPETYYDNLLDHNCQECKFPCLNCQNDTYCNTCVFSEPARLLINNDCACPIMYYSVQGIENCFECPYRCYQCETGDKCLQCRFPYFRLIENDCSCKDGYYDDGENPFCIKCRSQCRTCINGNECTSCLNQYALMPYCTQIMNHQFFSQNSIEEFQYQRCPLKCQNCYDRDTCMSCQGLNREGILKNCICKQGYHDEFGMQKDCQKCQKLCKNCLSSSYCNECQDLEHIYLYPGGKCDCELGFKYDQIKKKCIKAYRYKQDFYFQCPGNTVYSQSYDSCLDRKVVEEDKVFQYYLYGSLVVLASFVVCLVLIIKINRIIERAQNMTLEETCRFYNM